MLEPLLSPRCDDPVAWVEANLRFTADSSPNRPGKISLDRQPWARRILEDVMNPRVEEIWEAMGAQVGKTMNCQCAFALLKTFAPRPMAWTLPTKDLSKLMMEQRMLPFIRANEMLARDVVDDRVEKVRFKTMPLYSFGVQNPSRSAMMPISYLVMDEEAKYRHENKNEAHPVELLRDRTNSFSTRKIIHASTPAREDDIFWRGFESSSMSEYFIPCPYCGEMQVLEFTRETVVWDGKTVEDALRTARYVCRKCHHEIRNEEKFEMMNRGIWVDMNPDAPASRRGYHLNSLYSRFLTFGQVAAEFVRVVRDKSTGGNKYQNFVNSYEAKPFVEYRYRTENSDVLKLRRRYKRGTIPVDWYHYVAVAYDPGQNQTHWVAAAITREGAMYVIDWGTILSFKAQGGEGGAVEHFLGLRWGNVVPDFAYMDSGDWTEDVYQECRRGKPYFTATKGSDAEYGSWRVAPPKKCESIDLLTYVDYQLKRSFYGESVARQAGVPVRVPEDIDDAFVKGLSGQMLEKNSRTGKMEWKSLPNDHFGDCCKLLYVSWWHRRRDFEPAGVVVPEVTTPPLLPGA